MTRIQKLTGIAVFALAIGGFFLTAPSSRPPARLAAVNSAKTSKHSCIDMNGKAFNWSWGNVPFASICDAKPKAGKRAVQ
jgi:hypothetical protein